MHHANNGKRKAGAFARLAARAYGGLIAARNAAFHLGLRPVRAAEVPVVSIGNLSTGGTGKTPAVVWLVQLALEADFKPAVLSRGYRGGQHSDEVRLLQRKLKGVPVVARADRVAGAEAAVREYEADLLILDDGFQHRRINRDLDVVLIDTSAPLLDEPLLPAGHLREPWQNLRRADVVIMTRCQDGRCSRTEALRVAIGRVAPQIRLGHAAHRLCGVVDGKGQPVPPSRLAGQRGFLFCGLANPEAFAATVKQLPLHQVGCKWWPDHVRYRADMLRRMSREALQAGAQILITSEKDAVKLAELPAVEPPLHVVQIEFEPTQETKQLFETFLSEVRQAERPGSSKWQGN